METRESVTAVGRRCLSELDAIADSFVSLVKGIPAYASVPEETLLEAATSSLELLIRRAAGIPVPVRFEGVSQEVGRSRARMGIPLESLLEAVRLNTQVFWTHLLDEGDVHDKDDLVALVTGVLAAVERHTMEIQQAYLLEAASMAREQQHALDGVVRRLLATDGRDPTALHQVAVALQADPHARWSAVRCAAECSGDLADVSLRLTSTGIRSAVVNQDGLPMMLLQLPERLVEPDRSWFHAFPCAVATAESLEQLPEACRVATAIVDAVSALPAGPHTVREVWTHLASDQLGELSAPFVADVFRGLASVPTAERERLLETVRSYLESGRVSGTAAQLYCHRNTVLNRLARWQELTGYDLTVPDQSAPVVLALHLQSLQS